MVICLVVCSSVLLVTTYRIDFATSVAVLCKKARIGNLHEWLCTIPLYHFLKAFSEPYQKPPEKFLFLFNQERELDLDDFRLTTHYSEGYVMLVSIGYDT